MNGRKGTEPSLASARGARVSLAFPFILAAALVLAGTLPYCYGYWHAGDDAVFMGFVGRGVFGLNGYLMLARQAQEGYHLLENLTTSDPAPRVFFNAEWWLFGKMARWSGLPLIAIFHLWRVASAFLFVFSAWYLLRWCLDTPFQRKFALAWMTLGSGFGWMLLAGSRLITTLAPSTLAFAQDHNISGTVIRNLLAPVPADVVGVSVPAYIVNQPHFIRANACAMLMAACLIAAARTSRNRYFWLGGLAGLAHIAIRPYNIPEIYLTLALFPLLLGLREGRLAPNRFTGYVVAGLIMLPMVAYYAWLQKVNAMAAPGPDWRPDLFVNHVLWLGLPFLVMCLCLRGLPDVRAARTSSLYLALWFALAFLISQAYPYYRRGQEAAFPAYMTVPAILAIGPIRALYLALCDSAWAKRLPVDVATLRFKRIAAALVVVFCMPSFLVAYVGMFTGLGSRPAPYYVSTAVYEGLKWLEQNAGKHDTVLSSFEVGQLVPRVAGIKTYQGHHMITSNAAEKYADAERFLGTPGDDEFKRDLVGRRGIKYLFLGPQEARPNPMRPEGHPWLEKRFEKGNVRIYAVRLP